VNEQCFPLTTNQHKHQHKPNFSEAKIVFLEKATQPIIWNRGSIIASNNIPRTLTTRHHSILFLQTKLQYIPCYRHRYLPLQLLYILSSVTIGVGDVLASNTASWWKHMKVRGTLYSIQRNRCHIYRHPRRYIYRRHFRFQYVSHSSYDVEGSCQSIDQLSAWQHDGWIDGRWKSSDASWDTLKNICVCHACLDCPTRTYAWVKSLNFIPHLSINISQESKKKKN
jgi:hypothetical protein